MDVDRDLSVDATGGVAGAVPAGKHHPLASAPESRLTSLCRRAYIVVRKSPSAEKFAWARQYTLSWTIVQSF
jgi:hypothetical protein